MTHTPPPAPGRRPTPEPETDMATIEEARQILNDEDREQREHGRPVSPSRLRVSNWDTREEAEHAAELLRLLWTATAGDIGYPDPVVVPGRSPLFGRWEIVPKRLTAGK